MLSMSHYPSQRFYVDEEDDQDWLFPYTETTTMMHPLYMPHEEELEEALDVEHTYIEELEPRLGLRHKSMFSKEDIEIHTEPLLLTEPRIGKKIRTASRFIFNPKTLRNASNL